MLNIFDQKEMKDVFAELNNYENLVRKQKAFKQLDIYSGDQDKYIYHKLGQMYGKDALAHIQAITAINLATRIANTEASIYKESPQRFYTNATEKMLEQIAINNETMALDYNLMLANRLYRLGNQCQVQVIPKNGKLISRVLYQHQYDVVPMEDNPQAPEIYIVALTATKTDRNNIYNLSDNMNQKIADKNDADLARDRYVVWTKDFNFKCNGLGQIIDPLTDSPKSTLAEEEVINPIGRLPFIDVTQQKTMGFFVNGGHELSDFSVTFGVILSDLGEIVKLQGFSQAILSSLEEPKSLNIGPHRAMWLKKDKNEAGDKDPTFTFASPSPDLMGSMNYAENVLRMFLTSRGTDSKAVTSQGGKEYSSGFERLLSMVDRAEATKGDKQLFYGVEQQVFELQKLWTNYLMDTTDGFSQENKVSKIADDIEMTVKFSEPMQVMTQAEKEASISTRLELGLMTEKMAVMELYEVDEEKAEEMLRDIGESTFGMMNKSGTKDQEITEEQGESLSKGNNKIDANVLDAQKLALNGAQVTSLIEIVQSVATGNLPRESGVSMIEAAFNYDTATAESIMNKSGKGFKPSGARLPTTGN